MIISTTSFWQYQDTDERYDGTFFLHGFSFTENGHNTLKIVRV
jgi:hypothetical protein